MHAATLTTTDEQHQEKNIHAGRQTEHNWKGNQPDRQAEKERQRVRETDRESERERDKETERQ